jgi:hypothetical protein
MENQTYFIVACWFVGTLYSSDQPVYLKGSNIPDHITAAFASPMDRLKKIRALQNPGAHPTATSPQAPARPTPPPQPVPMVLAAMPVVVVRYAFITTPQAIPTPEAETQVTDLRVYETEMLESIHLAQKPPLEVFKATNDFNPYLKTLSKYNCDKLIAWCTQHSQRADAVLNNLHSRFVYTIYNLFIELACNNTQHTRPHMLNVLETFIDRTQNKTLERINPENGQAILHPLFSRLHWTRLPHKLYEKGVNAATRTGPTDCFAGATPGHAVAGQLMKLRHPECIQKAINFLVGFINKFPHTLHLPGTNREHNHTRTLLQLLLHPRQQPELASLIYCRLNEEAKIIFNANPEFPA